MGDLVSANHRLHVYIMLYFGNNQLGESLPPSTGLKAPRKLLLLLPPV